MDQEGGAQRTQKGGGKKITCIHFAQTQQILGGKEENNKSMEKEGGAKKRSTSLFRNGPYDSGKKKGSEGGIRHIPWEQGQLIRNKRESRSNLTGIRGKVCQHHA